MHAAPDKRYPIWYYTPCYPQKFIDALEKELQLDTQPSFLTYLNAGKPEPYKRINYLKPW